MFSNLINNLFFGFDYSIMSIIHNASEYAKPILTSFAKIFEIAGNKGILFFIIAIFLIITKIEKKLGITILITLLIASFLGVFLKEIVGRPRPFNSDVEDFIDWWTFVGSNYKSSFSFPSGHVTMLSAYMMSILIYNKRISTIIFMIIFVVLMSASRVYLMVHYPSDCIAGFLTGVISAIMGLIISKYLFKKIKF